MVVTLSKIFRLFDFAFDFCVADSNKEEILHEAALCTLLTLVDVPMLDGIVNANQGPRIIQRSSFTQQSLVFSNFNLQRNSAPEYFCSLDGRYRR